MELRRGAVPDALPRVALVAAASLAGVAAGCVGPAALTAQDTPWRIASVRMVAALDPSDGSAAVTLSWTLTAAEPGGPLPLEAPIPVELLGFGDATATEVERDGGAPVVLWPTHGSHRAAALEPPFEAGERSLELELAYRAVSVVDEQDGVVRVRIPVLTGPPVVGSGPGSTGGALDASASDASVPGGAAPGGARPGTAGFEAVLRVPETWRVADGFPSGLRRDADGTLRASLPVAPSMVGFRARSDGTWRPGFPHLVDALTLLVLFGFGLRGWLHLRGVVSGRRGDPGRGGEGTPVGGVAGPGPAGPPREADA